jgi:hypothetical protein
MYVFSMDIPFKGNQSLAKRTSKVTAVSYLHSGVNDTAVHVTSKISCQGPFNQYFQVASYAKSAYNSYVDAKGNNGVQSLSQGATNYETAETVDRSNHPTVFNTAGKKTYIW